ncbi:MAG: hypothetical protein R3F11_27160 [Verrucomicrobiales bacterium]
MLEQLPFLTFSSIGRPSITFDGEGCPLDDSLLLTGVGYSIQILTSQDEMRVHRVVDLRTDPLLDGDYTESERQTLRADPIISFPVPSKVRKVIEHKASNRSGKAWVFGAELQIAGGGDLFLTFGTEASIVGREDFFRFAESVALSFDSVSSSIPE